MTAIRRPVMWPGRGRRVAQPTRRGTRAPGRRRAAPRRWTGRRSRARDRGSTTSRRRSGSAAARGAVWSRRPVAGAAALVAVGLVLALVGKTGDDPPPPPPDPIPTPVATVVDTIPVAQRPNAIAATARDVWVTSSRSESLTRVNARRNRVTDARLVVGVGARDVATRRIPLDREFSTPRAHARRCAQWQAARRSLWLSPAPR